jgi:hypothetical protein
VVCRAQRLKSTCDDCNGVGGRSTWPGDNLDGSNPDNPNSGPGLPGDGGDGGAGVGGGDTCYDGPGSDPSLPLCELHPDDATEIVA